jgi:pyridoxine 4-dehydrogenase
MAAEPATQPASAAGTAKIGDLSVNRMAFGAMRITGPGVIGEPDDRENALAVLRRAVELGVNFIDTADSYGPEVNERQIADALHPYPEGLVIGTKGGLLHERRGEWRQDGRPESLRAACESSLQRLRLDRIDLYQLHSVDPRTPLEESLGALVELQQEGKIRHIGLSNVDARQLARAQQVATIVSVQNRYNVADRGTSEGALGACERDGIAFLPWFPLGLGELAHARGRLREVAFAHSATPAQIALAWLLRRSPVMVPIPGSSTLEHLEENVAAAAIELTDSEFDELSGSAGALL